MNQPSFELPKQQPKIVDDYDAIRQEAETEKLLNTIPSFEGVDALTLSKSTTEPVDWLVDRVIGMDQPTIFGGRSKVCKTTMLCDLAVAVATNTDFLGFFKVPKRRRVLFITGEANNRAISRRLWKALKCRSMDWNDIQGWLRTETLEFPQLPNMLHRLQILEAVKKHDIEVCIIDPLYRGLNGIDTHKVGEVGDAIVSLDRLIKPCQLILSHHTTKAAARDLKAPELEDLTGSGIAESCGNWWLIGRREQYHYDRVHHLEVVYGGRDEQAGIKAITLDESGEAFTWQVDSIEDAKVDKEKRKQEERQKLQAEKLRIAKAAIKRALANEKQFRPKSWIEDRKGESTQASCRHALSEMLNRGELAAGAYIDDAGKRRHPGYGLPGVAVPLEDADQKETR